MRLLASPKQAFFILTLSCCQDSLHIFCRPVTSAPREGCSLVLRLFQLGLETPSAASRRKVLMFLKYVLLEAPNTPIFLPCDPQESLSSPAFKCPMLEIAFLFSHFPFSVPTPPREDATGFPDQSHFSGRSVSSSSRVPWNRVPFFPFPFPAVFWPR